MEDILDRNINIIEELYIKHSLIGSEMSSIKLFVMNIYLMTHESFIFSRRNIFSFKRLYYDMIILTWHLFAQWGMQKFNGCFICFRWHWILQPYFYIAQGLLLHIFARRKNLIFLFIYQFNMTVNILYPELQTHSCTITYSLWKIIIIYLPKIKFK